MILYMNKGGMMLSVFAILFGAFMFIYGEIDDNPGGQLLGLLAFTLGVVGVIRSRREISD